ncbi:Translocation and assembly module TamA precursor [Pigmentiphaga humi]|uniref:Translocation and assembly module TamA n=1 Tax=Pigmentiphaga humi TaxID=2478468 RepID=A0A3P4B1M2_9BURK|nr:BamA/TamA family outer membrane protein [Pigmentiphaga humi]VCU70189.1 Translocation and assembly module TamA precursor [Pigmentiphaga humi]
MRLSRPRSFFSRLPLASVLLCALLAREALAAKPEVTIDPGGLPASALEAVTRAVDSMAEMADDQDGGEGMRLRRRAREATQDALATEGYFSAQVELEAGTDVAGPTWDISITPGERTTIETVDITFMGAIADAGYAERAEALRQGWELQAGSPFRNSEWETAKRNLLDAASERDFPVARLVETAADINADRARAALHVRLDSGPAVRLSGVEVHGLKRVPPGVVERYVRVTPGEPYDRSRMVGWQQTLSGSPFFSGAKLDVDRRGLTPDADEDPALLPEGLDKEQTRTEQAYRGPQFLELPVLAEVVESRPRRMSVALGIDDEAGPRIETVYRQNVVLGHPFELEAGLRLDRLRKLGYADIHLAPNENGFRDSFGVLAQDSDIQGLHVRRLAVGAIRAKTYPSSIASRVEYETRYGARLAHELTDIDGYNSYTTSTATATAELIRRDVNDKYDPREGSLIALGGGVGAALDGGNHFNRLSLRGQYWWSPSKRDVVTVRGEVGRLWAQDINRVPDDFSFRTGGARTVRGYRYLGLGREVGNAVLGDSVLFVASVEGTHYFDDRFGAAVFVDTGNVASRFSDMKLATGVGAGLRVKTPAGPLSVDLAYALRDKNIRLHFSLGVAF